MRLREPLYGWRVSQMHPMIHLCLFVYMLLIDLELGSHKLSILKDDIESDATTLKLI